MSGSGSSPSSVNRLGNETGSLPEDTTAHASAPGALSDAPADRTSPPRNAAAIISPEAGSSHSAPPFPDDKTVISQRPPEGNPPPPALIATSQHLGAMLIGKRLEHYELIEFVGGGGMGAVFRANDLRLGRTVAVKVLSRDHTDEETIRRFRNEAQSAARLDHPNIARVYYVGEDFGWHFIVFEFIEGTNLRDLVDQDGPLSVEDALDYTLQVAEALAHSSSRDVIHRDIKPSNVLVMAGGGIKLVDMGLARLHQVQSSSDDLTASGVTLGTFDYISPEQARDPRSADVRSDIYSLGCTLFYSLVGQPPFPDGTALQKLLRHNADEPPDLRHFRPEINPKVSGLLAKMLAKRPSQRQQSANDLIVDILALAEQLGISNIVRRGNTLAPTLPTPKQFWARATQVAVAVIVLLAAVVIVDAYSSSGETRPVSLKNKFATDPAAQPFATSPGQTDETNVTEATLPETAGEALPSGNGAVSEDIQSSIAGATAKSLPLVPPPVSPPIAPTSSQAVPVSAPVPEATLVLAGPDEASAVVSGPAATVEIVPVEAQTADVVLASTPSAPLTEVQPIMRLVVANQAPTDAAPQTEYQTSIAAASRRAAELGLTEIELAWDGFSIQTPLEIPNSRLVLRAAENFHPVILFRPQLGDAAGDRHMIRLAGGSSSRLTIQGVELHLELPNIPASDWSLLSLTSGQTLELSDCVLTVQDGDAEQLPMHDRVTMISVSPRRTSETMSMNPQASMASPATITLDRCIARGEATFLTLVEETPLTLQWNQGLLITPKRLIETSGSASNPKWFERIRLKLDHVTANCRQGLHQMKRRSGASGQFGLEVTAENSILMTDAESPLYEFIGPSTLTSDDLNCDGQDNRYPREDVLFLRVKPLGSSDPPMEYRLEESGQWSNERGRQGIPWRQTPPVDRPAHQQTKEQYLLDATADVNAGFDPVLLPDTAPMTSP